MNKSSSYFLVFVFLFSSAKAFSQAVTTGPEKGTLVVVGGGGQSDSVYKKFIELAGGPDAPVVIIPTADGVVEFNDNGGTVRAFKRNGARNITVLHTTQKEIANTDSFVAPLKTARAVWFGGGRQWRLVDAYKGTKTEKLFWELLNRGGVIGGTSAGATIQGSYLARGDTRNNQIMMGDHEEGFGFIKNIAIDQHVLARNRQFDLFNILQQKPELLGIGLDENTAIIVQGDSFEVYGNSYVLVYDGTFWSREGSDLKKLPRANQVFYFLRPGDKYNMRERKVIR